MDKIHDKSCADRKEQALSHAVCNSAQGNKKAACCSAALMTGKSLQERNAGNMVCLDGDDQEGMRQRGMLPTEIIRQSDRYLSAWGCGLLRGAMRKGKGI